MPPRLTLEQINKNRAGVGLPKLKPMTIEKDYTLSRKQRRARLVAENNERKRVSRELGAIEKERTAIKTSLRVMKKVQQEKSFLIRKKACKEKLFEYLCNPENPPIVKHKLKEYIKLAGYNKHAYGAFNKMFPPAELIEIENIALEQRRKQYANRLATIDDSLFNKAASGNAAEVKLVYQRFEGWHEKQGLEITGSDGLPLTVIVHRGADRQITEKITDAEIEENNEHPARIEES